MPVFSYEALDARGKSVRGHVQQEDRAEALRHLGHMGYQVLSLAERSVAGDPTQLRGRVKLRELMIFTRQFQALVAAGVGIVRALDILQDQTRDLRLRSALTSATRDVGAGASLTDAFAKHPNVFSPLFVSMIRAAEAAGTLDVILQRLAAFLEKQVETRQRLLSALMYPFIVLVFSMLIVSLLVFLILPKFDNVFKTLHVTLPWTTTLMIDSSRLALKYWFVFPLVAVAAWSAARMMTRTVDGRMRVDGWKLRLPILGDLIRKMAVSRFASTLATLLSGGVPIVQSLEIVSETAGNAVVADGVMIAMARVKQGQGIAPTLASTGVFPSMVVQMMSVGEETGELTAMLAKIAEFYDSEVDATIKGLTSIMEPTLIILLGMMVMFVALSVITPIYSMVSGAQSGV